MWSEVRAGPGIPLRLTIFSGRGDRRIFNAAIAELSSPTRCDTALHIDVAAQVRAFAQLTRPSEIPLLHQVLHPHAPIDNDEAMDCCPISRIRLVGDCSPRRLSACMT